MNGVVYVGLPATSQMEVAAALATFTNVTVTSLAESGGPLPSGWSSVDVGAPAQRGRAAYDSGTFGLIGGGDGIAGTLDQFHFAYTRMDGDVDLVARVTVIGRTNASSRAGVMIRDSLTPGGAHASMFVSDSRGTSFDRRSFPGGGSDSTAGSGDRAPVWLKLSVRRDVVTAFQSLDAVSWTTVGSSTVPLPSPFYVGLAITSHDGTATVAGNIDNVAIQRVARINEPPAVSLTTPADGATYTAPATVTITANASDVDGVVTRVDFFAGTTLIGSDTQSPYSITREGVDPGSYALTAVATDDGGQTTTSAAHNISVSAAPPNEPPMVSLTLPADGATYTAPASITITANASDADGVVARVDFFANSTLIGSDTQSPYSITWNQAGPGSYTLTAVATDDDGQARTSAPRNISVSAAPAPTTRTAYFSPSADHDTLVNSYLLEIFASGADPKTAAPIASQDLQKPAITNGECSADVSSTLERLAPGSYVLTVAAVGNGGSARSAPVTFTR
jgi:hypothetical protein